MFLRFLERRFQLVRSLNAFEQEMLVLPVVRPEDQGMGWKLGGLSELL